MTRDLPDHYAVLGVPATASPAEIAHAYRRRVRRHHPDTGKDTGPEGLTSVVAAYAVLRDPVRRTDYDRQRQSTEDINPAPSAAPFAPADRSRPLLRVGPVRYHGPSHRGHE